MSAVCPACGVAVVPGYVKCPKCHAHLPRRMRTSVPAGGTAVRASGLPLALIAGAVAIGLAVFVIVGLRDDAKPMPTAAPVVADPGSLEPAAPAPVTPQPPVIEPSPTPSATGPSPAEAARELERSLRSLRLWSNIEIVGTRIDVRSSACVDPAMGSALDKEVAALRDVGLTKLRCLAQSGAVVFERGL